MAKPVGFMTRSWPEPTHYRLFHVDCAAYVPGGRVQPYVARPDDTDQRILSQVSMVCAGCGTRLHVDVWPMQPVDVKAWSA